MTDQDRLFPAFLIRRYKRFLADVRLASGERLTVHCPNTGSMKNCGEPGAKVWCSTSDNKARKYRHTWELIQTSQGHMINVNSANANRWVKAGIESGKVMKLAGYPDLRSEVAYGAERSRIDLLLSGHSNAPHQDCYVEVKSVTLLDERFGKAIGFFPDAVSKRGSRHLRELQLMAESGQRAVIFFCVQHTGIQQVRPADHIDDQYGLALRQAVASGVEVLAYSTNIAPGKIELSDELPVVIP